MTTVNTDTFATDNFHSGINLSNTDMENNDGESSNSNNNIIYSTKTTRAEVRQVKVLVLVAVLFSMCGAVGVFYYIKSSENQKFQIQYDVDSSKVSLPYCNPFFSIFYLSSDINVMNVSKSTGYLIFFFLCCCDLN
jgi:hypothetical protein